MTSQPEPAPPGAPQASQITKPLRELAALVLLGANALLLFVGMINLFIPYSDTSTFTQRAAGGFFDFLGLDAILLPFLAVLLATHISPPVGRAKLITMIALIEYAVSVFFGVIAMLGWLFNRMAEGEFRDAFTGLLVRVAFLAIFAVAAFAVFKLWRTLYYVPKPKPQPGVYGHPQPYGQPGYPPAGYGQPGQYGQPGGYGQYGQPGGYGQPGQPGQPYGQPGQFGQPGYPAPPTSAPPTSGPPASGPPFQGAPSSAPPASAYPAPAYPASAPPTSAPPGSPSYPVPEYSVTPTSEPVDPYPVSPASAPPAPDRAPDQDRASTPADAPAPSDQTQVISGAPPAGEPDAEGGSAGEPTERTQVIPRPGSTGDVSPAAGTPEATERTQLINPASQQPSAGGRPPAPEIGDDPTEPHQR
ncbi:hypothetical protein O7627_27935 [Solwaraspora sp. WMMD1047]|uniref:hypothetical protein n=1 Tax=Solwaraspora sp. WMMD1047 TaxID=3016102 RepID=UPI0024169F24|nr:hypothetical protein [Solwaraspora sp. WMMD1047]MDG4833108.1 hypothetical protein [Solwaraspora sp. WMMD1047]